jgi:hypothetical protein
VKGIKFREESTFWRNSSYNKCIYTAFHPCLSSSQTTEREELGSMPLNMLYARTYEIVGGA